MRKLLMVSAVLAGAGLGSGLGLAQSQEQGKVISSTPVLKRVTEPRNTCTADADGKQRCTTQMVTEDRQIGYRVVYEYAGKQHEAQLPFPPGPTIPLEVSAQMVSPAEPSYVSAPVTYAGQPQAGAPVVVQEPYYETYYPSYYYDPLYPVWGLAVGYGLGYYWGRPWYGYGWYGGHGGGGHYSGGGHYGGGGHGGGAPRGGGGGHR